MNQEENTFEDPVIAEEWIQAIETEHGGSRDTSVYPLLKIWSQNTSFETVVEIGSGQGVCSEAISTEQKKYIGVEPSIHLTKRALQLYAEQNKKFIVASAYKTSLENTSVDAVFSVGVWFHLEDLDRAHKELACILRKGGEVLIITANPDVYPQWLQWITDTKTDGKKVIGKASLPTGTLSKNIYYLHTEEEMLSSLKNNGFEIISVEKIGFGKRRNHPAPIWISIRCVKN